MEEDTNKGGIVNHGFSVEFSSEDEDHSDVDVTHISFATRDSIVNNNGNNNKTELSSNPQILSSGTVTTTMPPEEDQAVNNKNVGGGDKDQHFSLGATALPSRPTTTETRLEQSRNNSIIGDQNAQTGNMIPVASVLEADATSLIPNVTNVNIFSSEIKKSSLSGRNDELNNENKEARLSKEYFRDVRLSLDASKPIQTTGGSDLPIHNGTRKSYSSQSDSDSFCDCTRNTLEHHKNIIKYVVQRPLFCFSVWTMFYVFWGDDALPGGSLFALSILELSALFLGYVAELLHLPGLLGMAAAGLILRNVPHIDVAKDFDLSVSSPLRAVSIVILLVRGAMGVNPVNIVKFKNIIPPLVIGSCVLEALAGTLAVYYVLEFPVAWASLMGCIMSAMSGVAVVPYLAPTEKYLSTKADSTSISPNYQKVITLVRTACGLDAMIAICMAEVALGFIVSEGETGKGVMKGAVEVIMGGAFGIVWGLLAGILLDNTSSNEKRAMTILACGVMSFMGFPKIGYPRAAPLAVFAGVLITVTIWKKKQVGGSNNEQLAGTYTILWYLFQPLLFGIIGARTDFSRMEWTIVWKGLICLAISLFVRFLTTFSATTAFGKKLSVKERIYLCIAWIPKGTVQAALGPLALDTVNGLKNLSSPDEYEDLGYKVMNLSLIAFIAPALLGCFALKFIGPRLLS